MRVRSPRWWALLALLPGLASISSVARGDASNTPGVRIDQLQPASPESPFVRAEGPHVPGAGAGILEYALGASLEYAHDLLKGNLVSASGGKETTTLVKDLALARLAASFTPLHWVAFDVALPIALAETGSSSPLAPAGRQELAGQGPGVGDLRIGLHFRPIDARTFGLILGGRVWAPFGAQSTYLSDGRARGEIDLGGAGETDRVRYGCTFNVSPGFFAQRAGDRVAGSCAAYFRAGESFAVGLEPSFEVVTQQKVALSAASAGNVIGGIFEPLVGLRFRASAVSIGLAAGPGFGGGMGGADGRALLSFAYLGAGAPPAPPGQGPPDRDLDGIPDREDACPDTAGPPSKDAATDGCPVPDRDGDGVPDPEDACPTEPGVRRADRKVSGCPDTDNDGIADPLDKCPQEPGPGPSGCPKFTHLGPKGFTIEPAIDFVASEHLRSEGRVAMEELAATLRANPKLARVTIVIGTKGVKGPLSDKRAHEILTVLGAANVDPSRYEILLKDDVRAGLVQVSLPR